MSRMDGRLVAVGWKPLMDGGWRVYLQALEHLDRSDWRQALVLLAEAETTFRADDDNDGLWRTLIGQAVLHRRENAPALALARAQAALQAATAAGDTFAAGCIAWQIADIALAQGDYRKASTHLERAQVALDAAGMAPPGGALAAAAQLCSEITRWSQACERQQLGRRETEAAIAEVRRELLDRLNQAAGALRAAQAGAGQAGEVEDRFLIPEAPGPAAPSDGAAPRPALGARLVGWWRRRSDAGTSPGPPPPPAAIALPPHQPAGPHARDEPAPPGQASEEPARIPPVSAAPQPASLAQPEAQRAPPAQREGLAVYCFGSFRVYLDDTLIERWESARARAIFKYLVTHRATAILKEVLADMFWPDSEPELARRSLHQAIYCLRQTFKRHAPDAQIIQFADGRYQINPAIAIWIDSEEFGQAIEQARVFEATGAIEQAMRTYAMAIDLYGGEFLAEDRYEGWTEESRRTCQALYLEALHHLARYHYDRGEHTTAILLGQRALAHESCDEESHRLLMACYMAQGLRHLAVRQFQLCASALKTELGVSPSDELESFYRRVVAAG